MAKTTHTPSHSLTDQEEVQMMAMLRHLKQIVAEFGDDYVYPIRPSQDGSSPGCWYVYEGQPDCLAGRVLHAMGVSLESLAEFEGIGFFEMPSKLSGITFFGPTREILVTVQTKHDLRSTWGDVRDHALLLAYHKFGVIVA